jgi:tetratricopeptide (TPR) repeat protein
MSDRQAVPEPTAGNRSDRITVDQFQRAQHALNAGQFDYAIELFLACCKREPANLLYRKFLRLAQRKRYQATVAAHRKPTRPTAADKMRLSAAKWRGDPRQILEVGEELLAHNPWDVGIQLDLADAADALGLLDVAIWILEQAVPKSRPQPRVTRRLAELYEKQGEFTKARRLWEQLHRADPSNREASDMARAMAAHETMARVQEEGPLLSAPAKPAEPETKESQALTKANVQLPPAPSPVPQPPDEEAALRARIAAEPANPNGYLRLAQFYRGAHRPDDAQKVLQEGRGPTGNDLELSMALAELDLDSFRRVLEVAERKVAAEPGDDKLRQARDRLLHGIHLRELELYRLKVGRNPTEVTYRLELGVRLLRVGQLDDAIRELQGVKSDPRVTWQACLYLGHSFKGRNNWRLAQRNFEEALKLLPSREEERRKELLFELATGLAAAGDLAAAVELAYELTDLHFDYGGIMAMLDTWQERLADAKEGTR